MARKKILSFKKLIVLETISLTKDKTSQINEKEKESKIKPKLIWFKGQLIKTKILTNNQDPTQRNDVKENIFLLNLY